MDEATTGCVWGMCFMSSSSLMYVLQWIRRSLNIIECPYISFCMVQLSSIPVTFSSLPGLEIYILWGSLGE